MCTREREMGGGGRDAHLGKHLHHVAQDLHSVVDGRIAGQQVCVVKGLRSTQKREESDKWLLIR